MNEITRRDFLQIASAAALGAAAMNTVGANEPGGHLGQIRLERGWQLQCSALVEQSGESLSNSNFKPEGWYQTSVPSTVLSTLVKNGSLPGPTSGAECLQNPRLVGRIQREAGPDQVQLSAGPPESVARSVLVPHRIQAGAGPPPGAEYGCTLMPSTIARRSG